MDTEITLTDVLEKLTDQKAKLENKLDKTTQKMHIDIEMLDHIIGIVQSYKLTVPRIKVKKEEVNG